MKRELIQNVKVIPYTSGNAIDHDGFLSGILAISVSAPTGSPTAAAIKVSITESETSDGTFTAVKDKNVVIGETINDSGEVTFAVDKTNGLVSNVDLDLVGCKRYVKLTCAVSFTGGTTPSSTNTYAVALGDPAKMPV